MNILLCNWQDRANPQAGGAEVHLFEIFSRLSSRGHRIRLVCSGWAGARRRAEIDGIAIERTGDRHSFARLGRGAVRRALEAERPDVVVEDINKIPLFLSQLSEAPFCAIVPHLFGSTIFKEAGWPVASLIWLLERPIPWAYRRADFHAISESTRDDLISRGVADQQIRVIHPGVDSTMLTPDPTVRRAAAPTLLYVGRLKRYKGLDFALRALARARKVRADLTLDVAGSGDDRERLEMLATELGLGSAVRFRGFVPHDVKLQLMRSAWANIFPSPKEGWGITNVEAAACGTPTLASNSPGLRDSVRHGETGFLVDHGDVAALCARILELADSPELVETLGRGARRFAQSLTWERAADETERHLSEIIARQKRVP